VCVCMCMGLTFSGRADKPLSRFYIIFARLDRPRVQRTCGQGPDARGVERVTPHISG